MSFLSQSLKALHRPSIMSFKFPSGPVLAFVSAVILALCFTLYTEHAWEDYYITYRSSKNLASGHGLVFNQGEHLHTFTSPLGVLLPAVSYLLTGNSSDAAALWIFRLMCIAALGGATGLLVSLARQQGYPRLAVIFLAALIVTDAKILDFTGNGMETAFMLLFVAYAVWAHMTPGSRRWLHLGAAWGGLMWTRPDSFIYIGLIAMGVWLFNSPEQTGCTRLGLVKLYVCAGATATALYLPWFTWAWWYYGSPVPHTIVAKGALGSSHAMERLASGWWRMPWLIWQGKSSAEGAFLPAYYGFPTWPDWIVPFGRTLSTLSSLLWIVPGLRTETRTASFAFYGGIVYLSFVPYAPMPWYYPTATLLAFIALGGLAATLWTATARWTQLGSLQRFLARCSLGGMAGLVLIGGLLLTWGAARQLRAQQYHIERGNRQVIGEWLHAHASSTDTVFMEPLGYIGFYSGLKTYDWPGLSSREVQTAIQLVGSNWNRLILYLAPTWVVLRSEGRSELSAISSLLNSKNYEFVHKFDRRDEISQLDIPGIKYLEFDACFSLYRLKNTTRHDAEDCEIASPYPAGDLMIGNHHGRTVHTPGLMIVPIPADARSVSGWCGFPPDARTTAARTDQAKFVIYWSDGKTRQQLWERTLHVNGATPEQGLLNYEVKFPVHSTTGNSRLIYETSAVTTSTNNWTAWGNPVFQPTP